MGSSVPSDMITQGSSYTDTATLGASVAADLTGGISSMSPPDSQAAKAKAMGAKTYSTGTTIVNGVVTESGWGYNDPYTGSWIAITDGSHKNGLESVPFDGYVAELHKDERVLTGRLVALKVAGI